MVEQVDVEERQQERDALEPAYSPAGVEQEGTPLVVPHVLVAPIVVLKVQVGEFLVDLGGVEVVDLTAVDLEQFLVGDPLQGLVLLEVLLDVLAGDVLAHEPPLYRY